MDVLKPDRVEESVGSSSMDVVACEFGMSKQVQSAGEPPALLGSLGG